MSDAEALFAHRAIELIAQAEETVLLRRSNLNVFRCGGCGGPAYQQPCAICKYYPMGSDKGIYSPKVATFEHFRKQVEINGRAGEPGTVATWYFKTKFSGNPYLQSRLPRTLEFAEKINVPSPRVIWDIVVVDGNRIARDQPPSYVHRGWRAMEELGVLLGHRNMTPSLSSGISETLHRWVSAVHTEDVDAMRETLEAARPLTSQGRSLSAGNMVMAAKEIDEALDKLPTRSLTI